MLRLAAALAVALLAFPVRAQEAVALHETPEPYARTYVNFRGGFATSSLRRPELCLDVAPLERLSIEACGTGSGFLHRDPDPEIAHFRAHWRVSSWQNAFGQLHARVSGGFAEVQLGEDDPGFQFTGVGPRGVETAGPELGLGLQAVKSIGAGFELIGNLQVGAVWTPFAGQLVTPMAEVQPFVSLTLGLGF